MSRIISYSLFESDMSPYRAIKGRSILQFTQFLRLIVRAHHVLWEGWELWLHHDTASMDEPYFPALQRLDAAGLIKLINCGKSEHLCEAMLWRMKPAFETDAGAVVCRDLDVIPGPLDRFAVEEWLKSGRAIHVIHFASAHSGIMGGTLAVRPNEFRRLLGFGTLKDFIGNGRDAGISFEKHGDDQHLLNMHYQRLIRDMLLHELDHDVGDLPAVDIRHGVTWVGSPPSPMDSDDFDLGRANAISPGIGVCDDPTKATEFYDSLDLEVIRKIQECER